MNDQSKNNQPVEQQADGGQEFAVQADIEKRREYLKNESKRLIDMASNEPNSALRCIHQLSVAGGGD